ncbi:FAD-dependent urate hydroxylase [Polyrhizophydium stewartii]|uniref:FAD-dependent urate hydroxylase n=1 Tax=Polyrhizophydium stewartii TaxID=2732419 RepID=A0ABR4MYD9_9FUNG
MFPCLNFGNCSDVTGKCVCPAGFGLNDCSQPFCQTDSACNPLVPGGQNGSCYNSMNPVFKNHVLCDVTNKAIVDALKERTPQLSLDCDKTSSTCDFQFWAGQLESFYCHMQECSFSQENTATSNRTVFNCPHMQCKCYPGRLLCEKGGLDFTDWFNNPEEGPNGPGTFECDETITDTDIRRTCKFTEPHMNEVISQFFGDPYIMLKCPKAGECLHYTQVPGYKRPLLDSSFSPMVIGLMLVGGVGLVVIVVGSLVWLQRKADDPRSGYMPVGSDDQPRGARHEEMMSDHVPCTIMLRDLSYMIETNRKISSSDAGEPSNPPSASQQHQNQQQRSRRDPPGLSVRVDVGQSNQETIHLSRNNSDDVIAAPEIITSGTGTPASTRQRKQKMVVLEGVQGIVRPGEVMAIMGGSGAGKTTFLDILARKSKSGIVSGEILVNGRFMDNQEYKSIIGYVDQEDTLMDTLTVFETILYSALLRLPKTMSYEAKVKRVEETMLELDILQIANRRVGSSGKRGLSGGEKRRVSIACELVTSPSILFLDEPTSGLDTYNAYNVIESLVSLARDYQRTVILTIHQPRSNIYALFDQLVLLAKGRVAYSGPAQESVIRHFANMGFECPLGFNIADYLVDLTMHVGGPNTAEENGADDGQTADAAELSSAATPLLATLTDIGSQSDLHSSLATHSRRRSTIRMRQESQLFSRKHHSGTQSPSHAGTHDLLSRSPSPGHQTSVGDWSNPLLGGHSGENGVAAAPRTNGHAIPPSRSPVADQRAAGSPAQARAQPSAARASAISARRDLNRTAQSSNGAVVRPPMGEQLTLLIEGYENSAVGRQIRSEIAEVVAASYPDGAPRQLHRNGGRSHAMSLSGIPSLSGWSLSSSVRWVIDSVSDFLGLSRTPLQRARASWWTQFRILSGRTFRNLYRNPDLLRTHYVISVVVALICGFLFWKIDNTLAGFQNRLGVMFFICAVFGFSCLSSMQVFAAERLIFVRERANRYYTPITYFVPKILFDVLPLRVVPPIILGLICYHMIGLRPDTILLLRFLLVLVLFNLTAASVCLAISVVFKDVAVASLIATLVMLFEMLFGGLLLNKSSIPPAFQWLQRLSFFNYAFEALVVNEVNGLTLVEEKFGLKIDVPGSLILQAFGLNAQGYWEDVKLLCIMASVFFGVAFLWLQIVVKERR